MSTVYTMDEAVQTNELVRIRCKDEDNKLWRSLY